VFSSKRVKGFLENAGQRDLLAQFQSIEAEMASRMKSESFILVFSVVDPDSLSPDPDPAFLGKFPSGSGSRLFLSEKNLIFFWAKIAVYLILRPP
jgi:hypothetical protein